MSCQRLRRLKSLRNKFQGKKSLHTKYLRCSVCSPRIEMGQPGHDSTRFPRVYDVYCAWISSWWKMTAQTRTMAVLESKNFTSRAPTFTLRRSGLRHLADMGILRIDSWGLSEHVEPSFVKFRWGLTKWRKIWWTQFEYVEFDVFKYTSVHKGLK